MQLLQWQFVTLKMLALQNVTINKSEVGVWLHWSSGFRPQENRREIHAYPTEASKIQINPTQGECGLKSCLTLLLWGFLDRRPGLCSTCQAERKIIRKHTRILLVSGCLHVSEILFVCSIWTIKHLPFLFFSFLVLSFLSLSLPLSPSSFKNELSWKCFKFYIKYWLHFNENLHSMFRSNSK